MRRDPIDALGIIYRLVAALFVVAVLTMFVVGAVVRMPNEEGFFLILDIMLTVFISITGIVIVVLGLISAFGSKGKHR